ncbi:hypothetical protein E0H22_07085 [Rhodopseudomonas boonkerdii]|uniref:hypothetical protein n=1 Tax=Rhodopseudomonas boonkerdii TaxID=475937 RepID=UPI001E5280DE|nr:hypothetical protein [Rhodopseudomonas boonkerdii]UGV25470.1 hypothetical protein E0H22_07085 [Rhodopseudomonas boonkerdii]
MSMKNYSIEKIGTDYVVKVADQSVMKMGSRRRAAQLVVEAQELLEDAPLASAEPSLDDREVAPAHRGQGDSVAGSVEGAV